MVATVEHTVLGQRITRIDGIPKVTGRAEFAPDVALPGMLHGKILRSPYAHARIRRLDTSRAERLPGVLGVATAGDLPPKEYSGSGLLDQPAFAVDKVRYVGEPVAAVAAVDLKTAERALELIEVEYEALPALLDAEESIKPGAPLIHEELLSYERLEWVRAVPGSNICNLYKVRQGDVERGFAESDFVFEDTFGAHSQQHAPLEPHAALAWVDPNGRIVFQSSTTRLHPMRVEVARMIGHPASNVRGIATYQGGSCGAKGNELPLVHSCVLAEKTGRPVRIVFSREESTFAIRRHSATVTIKTGVKRDGTLVAREVKIIWDTGAYGMTGPNISINSGAASTGPYRIPNVKVDSYCVYTNKVPSGSFRGFGTPQVTWAFESQMDIIAHKLGIDPLELRLKNGHEEGDRSTTGEVLKGVGLKKTLLAATEAIGWGKPSEGPNRGKGFACGHKVSNSNSSTVAYVTVNRDGSVQLLESVMDSGPGEDTTLAMIVAEELRVPFESVSVVRPDTDATPHDFGTVSSRVTFYAGNACRLAAIEAKKQLTHQAAMLLEVSPEDIEWRDGKAHVKGVPGKTLPIAEVSAEYYFATGGNVFGKGTFKVFGDPPDEETGQTARLSAFWMYVTQAAEVEVDRETGEVRVLRMVGANDAGKTINPLHAESQVYGGLVHGLGYSLTEDMQWDSQGNLLTADYLTYAIPTALDPPPMEARLVEAPHPEGPFGAKGMAETGLIPTAPAIANAIFNAVGVRIKDLPITAEKVLKALKEQEAEGQAKARPGELSP